MRRVWSVPPAMSRCEGVVVVLAPWPVDTAVRALFPKGHASNLSFVHLPVADVDKAHHPDRLRPSLDVGDSELTFADTVQEGTTVSVLLVGAELLSLVRCRRLLRYLGTLQTRGVKAVLVPIVGTRRMRLAGQVGWPFVDALVRTDVPVRHQERVRVWCKSQHRQCGSRITWTRADGVDVQVISTVFPQEPGSMLPAAVIAAAVERRNTPGQTQTPRAKRGTNRPVVFVSNHAVNRKTGAAGRLPPRMKGEAGWGAVDRDSMGYGCDRFLPVGPGQVVACAAHVSELPCYAPGDPAPFRVLFTAFPPDETELDAVVNDLSAAEGQTVYLVGSRAQRPVPAVDVGVLERGSVVTCCPFLPDRARAQVRAPVYRRLDRHQVRPVHCPHDRPVPQPPSRDADAVSAQWEVPVRRGGALTHSVQDILRRLHAQARGAAFGTSTPGQTMRTVAATMIDTGCTAFSLPIECDTGDLQAPLALVACDECSGSRRVYAPALVREVGCGVEYGMRRGGQVRVDTATEVRRWCAFLCCAADPWAMAAELAAEVLPPKRKRK